MASHGPEPPPAKKAKENSWDKNGDTFNKVASSAAAERNRQPIADVVVPTLKGENGGLLVELACGTGQHAAHIAPLLPALTWLPTDLTDESFDSIRHHCSDVENVHRLSMRTLINHRIASANADQDADDSPLTLLLLHNEHFKARAAVSLSLTFT